MNCHLGPGHAPVQIVSQAQRVKKGARRARLAPRGATGAARWALHSAGAAGAAGAVQALLHALVLIFCSRRTTAKKWLNAERPF